MTAREILVSDWLLFKKTSPLKLLGKMEPNLAGSDGNTSHGPGELKNDEKRAITPRRVIRFTSKLQAGRSKYPEILKKI
jgi:hypothetical protein